VAAVKVMMNPFSLSATLQLKLFRLLRQPQFAQARLAKWMQARMENRYVKLSFMQGAVWVCPGRNIGWHVFNSGRYEPTISNIICHFVEKGYSFIDIGANLGLHTLAAAFCRQHAGQRFLAFEPEPAMFTWLQRNCQENELDFVVCYPMGVADEPGEWVLYTTTDVNEGGHSLFSRPHTHPGGLVQVDTLTNVMDRLDWPADEPVLIKLDIEGAEPLALQGGLKWLSQRSEAALLCEVSPTLLQENGRSEHALLTLLQDAGFTHFYLINDEDSFSGNGSLRNDYFNLLCLKGKNTVSQNQQLNQEWFLTRVPPNAPDFVDWQAFSSHRLALTPKATPMQMLENKADIKVYTFQSGVPLVGGVIAWLRARWGSAAARWLVQDAAVQQSDLNHLLAQIVADLDARLTTQDQSLANLARDKEELASQIADLNRRLAVLEGKQGDKGPR